MVVSMELKMEGTWCRVNLWKLKFVGTIIKDGVPTLNEDHFFDEDGN